MDEVKRYFQIKEKAESLQRRADQSKGAYTQLLSQLEREHDCKTIEQAEVSLKDLKKELGQLEEELLELCERYDKKYGDLLKGAEDGSDH